MAPRDDGTIQTALRSVLQDFPEGTFLLRVIDGPSAGNTLEVDGASPSRLYIGKSSGCDLIVLDEEVSRRHCALELSARALRITDLESTNGTFVDHVRVRDASLAGGETLRVGRARISVEHRTDGHNPPVPAGDHFGRLMGQSRAMRRLYPLAQKLADSYVSVLIEGETGTGKEVLAEALHEEGPLASKPFVVFDCTTVPPNLVETELFGHERGAFTGAVRERKGVFEQADGGTLFLDEIGDLDVNLQSKLLRVVERGEFRRVGGSKWLSAHVRILCATRRDLEREVAAGRFRDDLFHRLAVARIELPPLRSRTGDVELLARHFFAQTGGRGAPSAALLAKWAEEPWPGNVRELRNAVQKLVAIGDLQLSEDFSEPETSTSSPTRDPTPDMIDAVLSEGLPLAEARARVVQELERRYLEKLLHEHGGNVSHAAAASGIARRHLQRLRAKSR